MVADDAVVGKVAVGHNPVVVADAGFAYASHCAEVEGGELADGVAVADGEFGRFAAIFFVLRDFAQTGELEDAVVFAYGGVAVNHGVRADFGIRADSHVRADDGVCADFDAGIQLCLGVDDGGRVDEGHRFPFMSGGVPAVAPLQANRQYALYSVFRRPLSGRPSESQPFSTMRCAHMMVASQASSPFTLAVALNLPMPRRCASSSTSNTSWSPGTT